VQFARLSEDVIATYVASGDPMDKAGSYGIQGRGAALVERIDGDFHTVMGFPLGDFVRRLPELGYALPPPPLVPAA
jgi:septum formation protein